MEPSKVVSDSPDALAKRVAERIAGLSHGSGSSRVSIALSGGSTPKRLYETLAEAPIRDAVDWSRLEFFFGDERSVPPDHADSNYGMAKRALLSKVEVVAHRMKAESGEAEAYEALLRERITKRRGAFPVFDLVLLGLGPDAHTASLFPGTTALAERERWVVMNYVPKFDTQRMTLTYPVVNAAERVWLMTAGADKREVLSRVFARAGTVDEMPILGVQPTDGELVWWLDRAAAGT